MSLCCGSQLSPYVDTPVNVTNMWTGPMGSGLPGNTTDFAGGTYQSSVVLTSLAPEETGIYVCSVTVSPADSLYVTGTINSNTIEGSVCVCVCTCVCVCAHFHVCMCECTCACVCETMHSYECECAYVNDDKKGFDEGFTLSLCSCPPHCHSNGLISHTHCRNELHTHLYSRDI